MDEKKTYEINVTIEVANPELVSQLYDTIVEAVEAHKGQVAGYWKEVKDDEAEASDGQSA